jgi:ABC-type polysaccharide/polyol phosphate transport system ATPase subunit
MSGSERINEQPNVGPKGAASGTMQINGCRRRARRASRVGRTANQIDAKIEEIIDFADIREFIDMPVQSYSSGMSVRLGSKKIRRAHEF